MTKMLELKKGPPCWPANEHRFLPIKPTDAATRFPSAVSLFLGEINNFLKLIRVLKAVAIVSNKHFNLSLIFLVSHFWIAKVSPEWRLNLGFGTQKKCPFPFKRGGRYKDYVNIFPGPNFVSLERRCPLNRGVPKERFHCNIWIYPGLKAKLWLIIRVNKKN